MTCNSIEIRDDVSDNQEEEDSEENSESELAATVPQASSSSMSPSDIGQSPAKLKITKVPYSIQAVQWSLDTWPKLLSVVPDPFHPQLLALSENSHSVLVILLILLSLRLCGRPMKFVHWSMIYVAGLLFGLVTFGSVLFANAMLKNQEINHIASNRTGDYQPLLPLDLTSHYDYRNVTRLMLSNGSLGRDNYLMFLLIDTFNIINFLWLHRSLLRLTYKDDVDMPSFMVDMLYRLPAVYAGLDLFENVAAASFIGWFEYDALHSLPYVLSPPFILQTANATRIKWGVLYILVALEFAGSVKYLSERRWKIDYELEQKAERLRAGIPEPEVVARDEGADSENEDTPYVPEPTATYSSGAEEDDEEEVLIQKNSTPSKKPSKRS
ncbi:hypothetical protein BASA83_003645 [Batrachochytrium salamandrivorans]|nr:hypothetical protein BASA83_003645 [Batrachochytrium salamandrivorans]